VNLWRVTSDIVAEDGPGDYMHRTGRTDYVATVGDSMGDVKSALEKILGHTMTSCKVQRMTDVTFLGEILIEGRDE
jgi:hypothetical protein